jgi:hypothetical protein
MSRFDGWRTSHAGLHLTLVLFAGVVLPPLLALVAAPVLLVLFPVAWLAIPFLVASLLSRVLSAQRAQWIPHDELYVRSGLLHWIG